jgi:hypothetical protein
MTLFADLADSPDCTDCARRGWTYATTCRRCVARHISREPPSLAEARRRKLIASMTRDDYLAMSTLIAEERRRDAEAEAA